MEVFMRDIFYVEALEKMASSKKEKSRRFLISLMVIFPILFALAYVVSGYGDNEKVLFNGVVLILFAFTVLLLYWYLQIKPGDSYEDYYDPNKDLVDLKFQLDNLSDISKAIQLFKSPGQSSGNANKSPKDTAEYISSRSDFLRKEDRLISNASDLSDVEKLALFEITIKRYQENLSTEKNNIEEKLQSKSDEHVVDDLALNKMTLLIKVMTSRLNEAISQLSKRGDIYIVIGSGLTIIAGYILYTSMVDYLSLNVAGEEASILDLSMYDLILMGVKISVVLFVEVFAFYYLRLYREIVKDVKYYQNEITNIEVRLLALYAIDNFEHSEALSGLVGELSKVERNFLIDKKHTTIDLEKSKHDSSMIGAAIGQVTKLINTVKK